MDLMPALFVDRTHNSKLLQVEPHVGHLLLYLNSSRQTGVMKTAIINIMFTARTGKVFHGIV